MKIAVTKVLLTLRANEPPPPPHGLSWVTDTPAFVALTPNDEGDAATADLSGEGTAEIQVQDDAGAVIASGTLTYDGERFTFVSVSTDSPPATPATARRPVTKSFRK